tara:strand:- start:857 stop:1924 length:1068 start_codon:yes stop_codon:yes gene_type:complete
MNEMVKIEDLTIPPNKPTARGMKVIGIYKDFDYENGLENGYGKNIAKEEGINEKIRDTIARAIDAKKWEPLHYPKPATMEKTDVEGIFTHLTGFTTLSGHRKAKKSTMTFYVVEFEDAPDEDGVMQTADFWRRSWRTRENVPEEFDYIKSDYDTKNIVVATVQLLNLSNYQKQNDGTYQRKNIASCLKSAGIKNPTDKWINDVRKELGHDTSVMTETDDFDITDEHKEKHQKLKESPIILTKTFSDIKDSKYDAELLESIEEQIVEHENVIKDKLNKKEDLSICVVAKTKNAILEKADKIRNNKKNTILDNFQNRMNRWRVIINLVDKNNLDIEDAFQIFWRGQKPDEKEGEIYE